MGCTMVTLSLYFVQVLRQAGLMLNNTHVISNRMVFDKDGVAVAFDSHIIHSLNKVCTRQ